MPYRVICKQIVTGYTVNQLEHEFYRRWANSGPDTIYPYLTLAVTAPDGLRVREYMRSGVRTAIDVTRREESVGCIFFVEVRGSDIEVVVSEREEEGFVTAHFAKRVCAFVDEMAQEQSLSEYERFQIRAVRGRPSERGTFGDYCIKVGVSEQTLRDWEKTFRSRGFDTGQGWQ